MHLHLPPLKTPKHFIRRVLRVKAELDNLVVENEISVNDSTTKTTNRYPKETLDQFMSHGANLVFQRIYIITSAENTVRVSTLDDSGVLCGMIYVRHSF